MKPNQLRNELGELREIIEYRITESPFKRFGIMMDKCRECKTVNEINQFIEELNPDEGIYSCIVSIAKSRLKLLGKT